MCVIQCEAPNTLLGLKNAHALITSQNYTNLKAMCQVNLVWHAALFIYVDCIDRVKQTKVTKVKKINKTTKQKP